MNFISLTLKKQRIDGSRIDIIHDFVMLWKTGMLSFYKSAIFLEVHHGCPPYRLHFFNVTFMIGLPNMRTL